MRDTIAREPAVLIGLVEAAVIAIVGLVAYVFGWDTELAGLVVAALSAVVALVGAVAIRRRVTPV